MPLRLKEDPREWRKSVLLLALGLALVSSFLRWRRVLAPRHWQVALVLLACLALAAWLQPRWFRGFYRVSMRLGYWSSQVVARLALVLLFVLVVTPLALVFRLAGKDPLRLKRQANTDSYWQPARQSGPLDRLF